MKRIIRFSFYYFVFLFLVNQVYSQTHHIKFNINNISTFIYNNGEADQNPNGNSSMTFPILGNGHMVYSTGVYISHIVNGEIRGAGSTYRSGLQPGRIMENGLAEDKNSNKVRVYRVRKDQYYLGSIDVSTEAADEGMPEAEILNQYNKDWNEWRGDDGAPYTDVNNNGKYESNIDLPGVPGADQTLWFVANDLDYATSKDFLNSIPSGLEMQVTIWGYKTEGFLGNVIFRKYVLINKGSDTWDSVYVNYWSDPDLGDAQDDFVGCDTTMNMIFCYNGRTTDATYGDIIPAMGAIILQGPITEGDENDIAYFGERKLRGKKNIGITSFHGFYKNQHEHDDLPLGTDRNGNLWAYYYARGLTSDGNVVYEPEQFGGEPTKFPLSGDPVAGTGWIDGIEAPPADRRMGMGSGPFTVEPGDTQVVVYAQAGAFGDDNIGSVRVLKEYATQAKAFYLNYSGLVTGNHEFTNVVPDEFVLHPNYPNPFNPTTTISFDLPQKSDVHLAVYDILGREVAILIDREMYAGNHRIEFNAAELSSGVYVYMLRAGDIIRTNKMILMK